MCASTLASQGADFGPLGNGASGAKDDQRSPVLVSGDFKFDAVTAGAQTTCALTPDKQAWCWGSRGKNGQAEDTDVPAAIGGGHAFRAVSASLWHTCALDTAGTVWCWGKSTAF